MDCKALIALLALIPALAFGQPMTPSELAWGNFGDAYGGYSFYLIQTNTVLTNALVGGGSRSFTFSASQPSHGVVSNLNSTTGTNTYTPTTDFVGYDGFDYAATISGASKRAPGRVDVAVVDTIPTNTCSTWIVTNHFFGIVSGGVTNGGTVCFPPNSPCPAGDSFSLNFPLNTNANWTLSFSDSMGLYAASVWNYTAGNPLTTWTPSASTLVGKPFFCVPPLAGGNCINAYGDVSTWMLCPSYPTCSTNSPVTTNSYAAYFLGVADPTAGFSSLVTNANYFTVSNALNFRQQAQVKSTNSINYFGCGTSLTVSGVAKYTYAVRSKTSMKLTIGGIDMVSIAPDSSTPFPWVTNFTHTFAITPGVTNFFSIVSTNGLALIGSGGGDSTNSDNADILSITATNVIN